jgi:4-carboxymuconolactone decarboxylase
MTRVSLIEESDHPELAELIGKLRNGRLGQLLKIYRLLLHSPAIAANWFEFANAVRWKNDLGGRLREMVIIRVALLNRVQYIIKQHVPRFAVLEGLTEKECEELADWRAAKGFSPRERAALAYTDAMTRDIAVPDAIFNEVRRHFDERQTVELTVLIATYNMTGRVLEALQVELESPPT